MSFLGPVNVLPSNAGFLPSNKRLTEKEQIFLRPHDVLVQVQPVKGAISARIDRIIYLGWEIRVELVLESAERVNAYLSREHFLQLQLQPSQRVYVQSKKIKIFSDRVLK